MVRRSTIVRDALFLTAAAVAAMQAHAQWTALVERYPSGSIQSEALADQALKDVEAERKTIDARSAESERACYRKFFATDCVQKVKDQRREALTHMRAIEIEAHAFKRRAHAESRENAAKERSARREAEAAAHVQEAGVPPATNDSNAK